MLNLSDKELDHLSKEAAQEYEPGEVLGPKSWERLEVRLDTSPGGLNPNPLRHIRRFPFYYAPALLVLMGVSYYFVKQGTKGSGSPPTFGMAKAPAPVEKNASSTTNSLYTDKSTPGSPSSVNPSTPSFSGRAGASAADSGSSAAGTAANGASVAGARGSGTSASGTPAVGNRAAGALGNRGVGALGNRGTGALGNRGIGAFANGGAGSGLTGSGNRRRAGGQHGVSGQRGESGQRGVGAQNGIGEQGNVAGVDGVAGNGAVAGAGAVAGNGAVAGKTAGSAARVLNRSTIGGLAATKSRAFIPDSNLRKFTLKSLPPGMRERAMYVNRNLQIGLVLAPDFTSVNSLAGNRPGSTIGLTLDYQFASHWYIGSGLLLDRKNYAARAQDYHAPNDFYQNSVFARHLDYVKGTFEMLEIPLNLRYDFSVSGSTLFFASAGVSSYLMTTENSGLYGNPWGQQAYQPWAIPGKHSILFAATNLSLGVETGLSNSLSLLIAPYMKIPTRGVGYGQVQMSSVGINFALKFAPVISRKRK